MPSPEDLPLVVVAVGTDHHPFDRLVSWVDGWASERTARVVIQHGTSIRPRAAEGVSVVSPATLQSLFAGAVAIVTHGGPGTIAAARDAGVVPIVVPRRRDLGEHVDDHQVRFVTRLAADGSVVAPTGEDAVWRALDRALADRQTFRTSADDRSPSRAAGRFGDLVERVVGRGDGESRLRVLFVAGWGRSGSTLLGRMLGQVPGVFSAGELRDVWLRGVIEDRLCGCGERFHACDLWSKVGQEAFGGWDGVDVEAVHRLRLRLDRPWSPPRVLTSRLTPALDADVQRYVDHLAALYRAIEQVSGAGVIVDSSKIPTYALLLRRIPGIDLRVLHLVRDSRGVVFSWQKQVMRPDGGGADEMVRYGAAGASARYVFYNGLTHGLGAAGLPSRFLRYEDLVARPRLHVCDVLSFAGMQPTDGDLSFLGEHEVDLAPNHTVDGNPMRLQAGTMPIELDEAWRRDMDRRTMATVTMLTAPMLATYGYRMRGRP
jgi:UDP-N-acetylglucosamine transferase subunit ALG13